jgi:Protein of unknown function (DUF1441)
MPRGGARPNSGPKPSGYVPPDLTQDQANFERERAEHERVKREQREFKLATDKGEYLHRDHVAQASATALSVLTQSLRSIPDNLERVCSLTPEQAELAQQAVDSALSEVATAFRAMAGDPA